MSSKQRSYLIGLIGAGIQESLTPAMHEREGDLHGMRYLYNGIDLSELGVDSSALPELLTAAERMGFTGLNITHPCKQDVIQYLDDVSAEAASIGAVNTVVFSPEGRIGHNTDASAFLRSFQLELGTQAIENVVIFGAGGAGTAVAHVVAGCGVKHLTLVDIRRDRAQELVDALQIKHQDLSLQVGEDVSEVVSNADGVINATPMGMAGYPGMAFSPQLLKPAMWVADVVYFPIETALLRFARSIGCPTMNGGGMAVFQAVDAFHHFTGVQPDSKRMLQHFDSLVREISATTQRQVV